VWRFLIAAGALLATALIVYVGRDGYVDNGSETPISFGDAVYYATVSLSTTGYGDIVPVTDAARLWTTLVITPLRLVFLIVLVGTTVELLTERSRQAFRIDRWRRRVRDHTVVVGYGTKGRAGWRRCWPTATTRLTSSWSTPTAAGSTRRPRRGW
jgi:voltage-gated potassium channel